MKITFEFPEVCTILSVWLYLSGHNALGYTLFGLSLILAFTRLGLKMQKAEEEKKRKVEEAEQFQNAILTAAKYFIPDTGLRH